MKKKYNCCSGQRLKKTMLLCAMSLLLKSSNYIFTFNKQNNNIEK